MVLWISNCWINIVYFQNSSRFTVNIVCLVSLVATVESHFQSFTNQLDHLSLVQNLTSRTQPNPTHFRAFFDRGLTFAQSEFCLFLTWCWCFARRWCWEVWWAQVEGRSLCSFAQSLFVQRLILPNYLSRKDACNSSRKTTWTLCDQDTLREVIREGWGGQSPLHPSLGSSFLFLFAFCGFLWPLFISGLSWGILKEKSPFLKNPLPYN